MLEEFKFGDRTAGRNKVAPNLGRIVGFREHVFTHNVSSIAGFFSLQVRDSTLSHVVTLLCDSVLACTWDSG
jgi:hypothetical protein